MFIVFIVMLFCRHFKGVLQVSQLGLSVGSIQSYRSTERAVVITFQHILHVTICRWRAERTVICALKFPIQERGSDWMAFKCVRQQEKQEVSPS